MMPLRRRFSLLPLLSPLIRHFFFALLIAIIDAAIAAMSGVTRYAAPLPLCLLLLCWLQPHGLRQMSLSLFAATRLPAFVVATTLSLTADMPQICCERWRATSINTRTMRTCCHVAMPLIAMLLLRILLTLLTPPPMSFRHVTLAAAITPYLMSLYAAAADAVFAMMFFAPCCYFHAYAVAFAAAVIHDVTPPLPRRRRHVYAIVGYYIFERDAAR